MIESNNFFHDAFFKAVDVVNGYYDEEHRLIRKIVKSAGYHTKLTGGYVHEIYASHVYALALFDTEDEQNIKRGLDILTKILSLQDQDETSETYGIWSYFEEEPLSEMDAPDYNWADFNGKLLVRHLIDHRNKLGDLADDVERALMHCARSIMKRNVAADYTNINIMGGFVTVKAGELLGLREMYDYGKKRLCTAAEYARTNGGFTEYNSPNYTPLVIEDLGHIAEYVEDQETKSAAQYLLSVAWKCIAEHFHPATGQLAPPMMRCYENFTNETFYSFIECGTQGASGLIDKKNVRILTQTPEGSYAANFPWVKANLNCPQEYRHYFNGQNESRFMTEDFYKGYHPFEQQRYSVFIRYHDMPALSARTYINGKYCLGSFTKGFYWNQMRPLMAFWQTGNGKAYIRTRFLRNEYDYCSALCYTSQYKNKAVSCINFATDNGNTHFLLDTLKEGRIRAESFKLRFELCGDMEGYAVEEKGDEFIICFPDITFRIKLLLTRFDGITPVIRFGQDGEIKYLDIVLYEGVEREFDFSAINDGCIAFGFEILEGMPTEFKIAFDHDKKRVAAYFDEYSVSADTKAQQFISAMMGTDVI